MKNPCATPGRRIRSKGLGRGLARGQGRGPIGVPYGGKGLAGSPNFGSGGNPLRGFTGLKSPLKR